MQRHAGGSTRPSWSVFEKTTRMSELPQSSKGLVMALNLQELSQQWR